METVFIGTSLCEIASSRSNAYEDGNNQVAAAPVSSFTGPESKAFYTFLTELMSVQYILIHSPNICMNFRTDRTLEVVRKLIILL